MTAKPGSSTTNSRWAEIAASLADKTYRDAFVEHEIKIGVPFQIRALRRQRGWSQKKLGEMAGDIAQETISQLENPNYGRMNVGTLLRLASAFDVGLVLRFVPLSDLVDHAATVTHKTLEVPSYADDARLSGGDNSGVVDTSSLSVVSDIGPASPYLHRQHMRVANSGQHLLTGWSSQTPAGERTARDRSMLSLAKNAS